MRPAQAKGVIQPAVLRRESRLKRHAAVVSADGFIPFWIAQFHIDEAGSLYGILSGMKALEWVQAYITADSYQSQEFVKPWFVGSTLFHTLDRYCWISKRVQLTDHEMRR